MSSKNEQIIFLPFHILNFLCVEKVSRHAEQSVLLPIIYVKNNILFPHNKSVLLQSVTLTLSLTLSIICHEKLHTLLMVLPPKATYSITALPPKSAYPDNGVATFAMIIEACYASSLGCA